MSTRTEPALSADVTPVTELTYREAVNLALEHEMAADPTVVLLGEDVASDGGVFKTNVGLLERFGSSRVINTPICENGFLGAAVGMAVTGLRPVVEIMFSDFLPTAGDAVVNQLPKFRFMSGGQCCVPVTVRAVGGATGRFGSQHSATGESWYVGLPGLKVATAASPSSAYGVLRSAIRSADPVLFFEHKALYSRKGPVQLGEAGILPVGAAGVLRAGADLTIVSTLLMADRAVAAADILKQDGISVEVVELCWLRPVDYDLIFASVERTGQLLVVEEQVHAGGWGATVISTLVQHGVNMRRPSALSLPDDILIPYSPSLEDAVVPSVDAIATTVTDLMSSR
jgi:pyruvate dehydrogenase E1 component beta subunit